MMQAIVYIIVGITLVSIGVAQIPTPKAPKFTRFTIAISKDKIWEFQANSEIKDQVGKFLRKKDIAYTAVTPD